MFRKIIFNRLKKIKKAFAFSLVELMVSLVVVSCITAALTPVITKKLSLNGVSIGSDTSISSTCSDIVPNCELCNEEKCLQCKNTCLDNQYLNIADCTCKECPINCEKCKDDSTCTKCKQGYKLNNKTCTPCAAGEYGNDGFSCNKCLKGEYQPNSAQIECLACEDGTYTNTKGSTTCKKCEDGYYCINGDRRECALNCAKCKNLSTCLTCAKGTLVNGICETPSGGCASGQYLSNGLCLPCPEGATCAGGSSGLTCKAGYYLNGSACTKCPAGKYSYAGATSCLTCPKGNYSLGGAASCSLCPEGTYSANTGSSQCSACATDSYSQEGATSCTKCSTTWENCTKCTPSGCSACKEGYELKNGSCVSVGCGDFAIKVNIAGSDYCMTKYNIGDGGLYIPDAAGVQIHTAGSGSCDSSAGDAKTKCCWKSGSNTANPAYCDTKNGGYSGCTRTLCTWAAAKAICENLTYNGYSDWRLLTYTEAVNLDAPAYTVGKGADGLMLCNNVNNLSGTYTACCNYNTCKNSVSHACNAGVVWVGDTNIDNYYCHSYHMYFGNFKYAKSYCKLAASVRCVRKL